MAIRIKKEHRKEIRKLLAMAVQAQTEVYDLIGEIEEFTGPLYGLDSAIYDEAGNWNSGDHVKIDNSKLNFILSFVQKDGE